MRGEELRLAELVWSGRGYPEKPTVDDLEALMHIMDTIQAAIRGQGRQRAQRLERALLDKKGVRPKGEPVMEADASTLAEAVFGVTSDDPRRILWCEVSHPWGLGTMKSLEDLGAMTHYYISNIGSLDNHKAQRALGGIYQRAKRTNQAKEFDVWLEGRALDPEGIGLICGRLDYADKERSIESIARALESMTLEEVQAIELLVKGKAQEKPIW